MVVAAFLLGTCVANAQPATMKLCTGGEQGNYFWAGNNIAKHSAGRVNIEVISSQGSMDNLERLMSNNCDAAFVQQDALLVYNNRNARALNNFERVGSLYKEYVHLVCNRDARIKRVTDLNSKHTVAIGPLGSGSNVTWEGFVLADKKKYGQVKTSPITGMRALAAVRDGTDVQCMIFTAGLSSTYVKSDIQSAGDKVALIPADDSDFDNAVDPKGKKIYTFHNIPGGTYPKLETGWLGGKVSTVAVDAVFVISSSWIEKNERAFDYLMRGMNNALPEIRARVGQ